MLLPDPDVSAEEIALYVGLHQEPRPDDAVSRLRNEAAHLVELRDALVRGDTAMAALTDALLRTKPGAYPMTLHGSYPPRG